MGIFYFKNEIKNSLKYILIISLISTTLLIYSNVYRPDAYLYHLPFISIINNHEIIIGLNNTHFRYALNSILQYVSAINYNYIFGAKGILIPTASAASIIIYYFYSNIKESYINKRINTNSLFCLSILIYIIYKINRYSEFGNDAIPALLAFYLVSIIQDKNFIQKNFNYVLLISTFIFINKTTLIFFFLIPVIIFIYLKKFLKFREYVKVFFSFPSFLLILWLLKNFLISGCLIYPLTLSCFETKWSNTTLTKSISENAEAWSKGWPENKKKISVEEFNKNFNWINAWSKKHFLYVIKILFPYIILLIFLSVYINRTNNKDYLSADNYINKNLALLFFAMIIFFIKFPLYRYGYAYLISFISLLFANAKISNLNKGNYFKILKVVLIISPIIFFGKQLLRVIENSEEKNIWPKFQKNELSNNLKNEILLSDDVLIISKAKDYCYYYYTNEICTQYELKNDIVIKKKFIYKILLNKKKASEIF